MKKKRKGMLLFAAVIAVVVVAVLFARKRGSGISEANFDISTNDIVRGSNGEEAYYLDVNQTGIFYLENDRMKYLDYETKQSYYLCDKANCLHQGKDCGAYAVNYSGLGAYQGSLYAVQKDYKTGSYNFMRMEMNGTGRKVIATIDVSDFQKSGEDGSLDDLKYEDIYYAYGKAYFQVKYEEEESYESEDAGSGVLYSDPEITIQIMCIDLQTGEKNILATAAGSYSTLELGISLISEDKIVLTKKEAPDALTGMELEQSLKDESFVEQLTEMRDQVPAEQLQDSWKESLSAFYEEYAKFYMADGIYSILVIDSKTYEQSVLITRECELLCDINGMAVGYHSPYSILDWYQGDLILYSEDAIYDAESASGVKLWKWNLSESDPEALLDIGNGAFPMMSFGSVGKYVRDGNKLIYLTYCEDGVNADISSYNLETGESEVLYRDTKYVTFRFLGETEDCFVGDMVEGDDHGIYIILKEDYYAGSLQNAAFLKSADF